MTTFGSDCTTIVTTAESWRIPTDYIEEVVSELAIGDGTVTVTMDGSTVGEFGLNDDDDTTIALTSRVPQVDENLDETSTNPVQNRVITSSLSNKVNRDDLATVATTGSYSDLSNTPTIDTALSTSSTNAVRNDVITTAINTKANTADLATVATTGDYDDLTGTPTVGEGILTLQRNSTTLGTFNANNTDDLTVNFSVPTTVEELSDASDYALAADLLSLESALADVATSGSYEDLSDTPTIDTALSSTSTNAVTNSAIYAGLALKANTADLATVATTGSYSDLSDTPTIDTTLSSTSTNAVTNSAVYAGLALKANTADLAMVATSGSYNDLSNTPTIGNAILTISKNGTAVTTFTANATTDVIANITVPTTVAELTDESNYYTTTETDAAIASALSGALTYKGSCAYADLPTSGQSTGDVWNITASFTKDGETYPEGTNVAWNGSDWDPLAGVTDLSDYYTSTETNSAISSAIGTGVLTIATTDGNLATFNANATSNVTATIPASSTSTSGTVVTDSSVTSTSTNPVQSSAIYTALSSKADSSDINDTTITLATQSATVGSFTTNDDTATTLTIPAATSSTHGTVIVDSALSSTSTNPVQAAVIYDVIGDVETILTTLNTGTGAS